MQGRKLSGKQLKFSLYLVALILVNLAAVTLFVRVDLTGERMYSLSQASKRVVSTLSEPLTIKVFFTKNLPAPHNHTERYLHDLLEEYSVYGDRYWNYAFYDVTPKEGGEVTEEAGRNQEMARSYGIDPIQIQVVEQDEVKFQKAYMGLVLIHGDLIERLPAITSTDGLEYRLTTAIQKLNNKVSALLRLSEKIQVRLVLSSSLFAVAPQLQIENLDQVPTRIESMVKALQARTYGKVEYQYLDPTLHPEQDREVEKHQVLRLKWPALNGGKVAAGQGAIGLVMTCGTRSVTVPILDVLRMPLIGTRYQLADLGKLEQTLNDQLESLIDINQKLGYLADHGTLSLSGAVPGMGGRPDALSGFQALVSQNYSIQRVQLAEGIPEGIDCLVIARPSEPFNDYELFQIDQFLMRGKSLALFLDPFRESRPPQQAMAMAQGPQLQPFASGIEKLLEHYGLRLDQGLVLDENCFHQQVPPQLGGGERPIYFAPIIKKANIGHDSIVMENIKGLVTFQAAPIELLADRIQTNGLKAIRLFASSEQSWILRDPMQLNPMFLRPPAAGEERRSYPLAYWVEGEFPSYFADRPMPEKPQAPAPAAEKEEGDPGQEAVPAAPQASAAAAGDAAAGIQGEGVVMARGRPGRILLLGASSMLQDNLLDEEGRSPNAIFIANALDALNRRDDIVSLRSKQQPFNPLVEIDANLKTVLKSINIVGLPILVNAFGLLVWLRRRSRRKQIQVMFQK